jgi:hypothetical protein
LHLSPSSRPRAARPRAARRRPASNIRIDATDTSNHASNGDTSPDIKPAKSDRTACTGFDDDISSATKEACVNREGPKEVEGVSFSWSLKHTVCDRGAVKCRT